MRLSIPLVHFISLALGLTAFLGAQPPANGPGYARPELGFEEDGTTGRFLCRGPGYGVYLGA